MWRRLVPAIAAALAIVISICPVSARSLIIAQKSSPHGRAAIYLSHALVPGHHYRIDVLAVGHRSFEGNGLENFTGVSQGRLYTGTKNVKLSGTTPRSFPLTQPPGKLSGWLLAALVQLKSGRGLVVRFVDTGP